MSGQDKLVDDMLSHLTLVHGEIPPEGHLVRQIIESVAVVIAANTGLCAEVGHNYRPGETGYHKTIGGNPYRGKSYARLFCSKCGDTIEVLWADHQPLRASEPT